MKRNIKSAGGNKAMERETATLFELNEIASNVLDFSTTLEEVRKNVDPKAPDSRAERPDRRGNIQTLETVEWHSVADILDKSSPNWNYCIKDIRPIGDIVTVTVVITIDGVTREGIGTGKSISENGIKKAEHDAFKRAAVKFGIARKLYGHHVDSLEDHDNIWKNGSRKFLDAMSKSIGDMITTKQLSMIRSIGRETSIDIDHECSRLMQCGIAELSKQAGSDLIEHLQNMQRNADAGMRRVG